MSGASRRGSELNLDEELITCVDCLSTISSVLLNNHNCGLPFCIYYGCVL